MSDDSHKPVLLRRERLVAAGVVLIWTILAARLVQIQGLQRKEFAHRARRQQTIEQTIPARPGDIFDRSGRLLATTTRAESLFVDPSRIDDPWGVSLSLSEAVHIDSDRLYERIGASRNSRFLWVKRRLSRDEADAVRRLDLPRHCWGLRREYLRQYPQGTLASHVLGLRDIDGIGRGGVEQAFDALLRGRDGTRRLVRDARGFVLDELDQVAQPVEHGQDIHLTLDAVVQTHVEHQLDRLMEEWKPVAVSAVVLDPNSGEIVAMASRPTFDQNDPGAGDGEGWVNRAIAAVSEPGSTFKPLIVAWALDRELLLRDEPFDCEQGEYRMGGRLLHDHHPYGVLSTADVLVKSSNIGMAKIGERLGNERLHTAATAFGFGRKTGVELPGELSGTLRPLPLWTDYSLGSIPMGQELSATPLQVVTAHAVLANGGRMITPHLFASGRHPAPSPRNVVTSRVIGEEAANWVVRVPLVQVVERGTGRKAALEDFQVFGKSGTAQKFDAATGQYSHTRHVCSFVCGAPADDPRLLVLVTVDEPTVGGPHFGGTVAAPAAAQILRRALLYRENRTRFAEDFDDAVPAR
ncbi:MAG: penicillin-binding protein 2 [Planctomycetota bacterium]|nr:MAG: penicillin-binding protein 2 [Planctomycetota bacterium]REJ89511.1 MAG: penicillin-binding protein 2 [Planctomycetota bacterium]REK28918.1 MAG: penicillin-binding protein 2 [Planctomycetota bacterium]REK39648.1 MAG: penicillin-binding protein 2 [Planctomycetota bacterium]